MQRTVEEIKDYAEFLHDVEVNQTYGQDSSGKNIPYSKHLNDVFSVAKQFQHLLPEEERETALKSALLHDSIEDARVSYNDVKWLAGEEVAEAVYALTNEKGKTRSERANDKYYEGLRQNRVANFVKLCDRIANMEFSRSQGSQMLAMYRRERKAFIEKIFQPEFGFTPMIQLIQSI